MIEWVALGLAVLLLIAATITAAWLIDGKSW
jgi:hypothetical protein